MFASKGKKTLRFHGLEKALDRISTELIRCAMRVNDKLGIDEQFVWTVYDGVGTVVKDSVW